MSTARHAETFLQALRGVGSHCVKSHYASIKLCIVQYPGIHRSSHRSSTQILEWGREELFAFHRPNQNFLEKNLCLPK
jgi:hypothetical protein